MKVELMVVLMVVLMVDSKDRLTVARRAESKVCWLAGQMAVLMVALKVVKLEFR